MSKRLFVLLVVCALALSVCLIGGAQADTSDWTLDTSSETVTFEPGDGETITDTVTVTNNDANESVDISASIDGGHAVTTQPGSVGPGESADIEVELDADGGESATLDVSGGGNSETVDYTVETPAYIEVTDIDDWVDDEGVLQGNSRTAEVTIEEVGGYSGFDGIDVSGDTDGLDTGGFGGLESASANAGETTTVDVTFNADSDADQYDDVGGTVSLDPGDGFDVESDVTIESFVAFPAYFDGGSLSISTFEFDEPRDVGSITRSATLEIENGGNRELDFSSVSIEETPFDVDVGAEPDTIAPTSSATVDVDITADTDLEEGPHDFEATFESSDFDVDDETFERTIQIEHEISMDVSPTLLSSGDIPIGDFESSSFEVSEELGYRDIENVELTMTEGPAEWIEVTDDVDSSIAAAGSSSVGYEIEFDPGADIGNEYVWTFEVEGEAVDTQEVTVTATPIPLNLDPLRDSLESAPSGSPALDQTSEETFQLVNDMDERIREDDVPQADITTVLTFGDGVVRYLEAIAATDELIEAGDHDAAQEELVRAAVAFDTIATYGDAIEDDDLRIQGLSIRETADSELQSRIETQEAHYEERLASEETSPIEEATIMRELARVAALQGDTERARSLEADAEAAFETYSTLVAEGEADRQEAVGIWDGMESEIFVSVLGQQLIVNPTHYDEFEERSTALMAAYDDAESAFAEAGETTRAETVAEERSQRESALTVARWSLFVSMGLTVLALVSLMAHTARGMYWYVRDSEESVSGDFLV